MRLLFPLFLLSLLSACEKPAAPAQAPSAPAANAPRSATGAQARALVAAGATLLDVRTVDEFDELHLPGAKNVPLHTLVGELASLPKDKPVVVYCAVGSRSASAASILAKAGYEVHNLGGMGNWNR